MVEAVHSGQLPRRRRGWRRVVRKTGEAGRFCQALFPKWRLMEMRKAGSPCPLRLHLEQRARVSEEAKPGMWGAAAWWVLRRDLGQNENLLSLRREYPSHSPDSSADSLPEYSIRPQAKQSRNPDMYLKITLLIHAQQSCLSCRAENLLQLLQCVEGRASMLDSRTRNRLG